MQSSPSECDGCRERRAPDRRGVLGWLAAAAAAVVLWPRRAFAKKIALPLDKLPELKEVNSATAKKIQGQPLLLIRVAADEIRAFDPTCTHQQCKVGYNSDAKRIDCSCHKSAYDLEGNVTGGPAPKPLMRFKSTIEGDSLILELPDPQ